MEQDMRNYWNQMSSASGIGKSQDIKMMFDPDALLELIMHDLRREKKEITDKKEGDRVVVKEEWLKIKIPCIVADKNGIPILDRKGNFETINKEVPPKMNEEGIYTVIGIFRPRLWYSASMSNFEKYYIAREVFYLTNLVINLIYENWVKWGIEKSYRSMLVSDIITPIEETMKRSLGGLSIKALTQEHKIIEGLGGSGPMESGNNAKK